MDRIVGQDHALGVLTAALSSGKVHHAYVFQGPAGVGKFTTALALAKALLCPHAGADLAGRFRPCSACPSCAAVDKDTHPDLHVVVKELARYHDDAKIRERKLMNIPVDVLESALLEPAHRSAQLNHHKVFIVDEAELIDPIGQNKLLKTLEEPPVGTYIILVTANPERLLATVRSRCQRVSFRPLPDEEVGKLLDLAAGEQRIDPARRAWLIELAGGSPGLALLALRQDLHAWARLVIPALDQLAAGRYPITLGADMKQMIDDFAQAWVKAHDNASKDAANRRASALMLQLISAQARKRLHESARRCAGRSPDEVEQALEPWARAIDALRQTERDLASNVNLGLATDHLVALLHEALAPLAVS